MTGANKKTVFELSHIDPNEVKKSSSWFNDQIQRLATKKITPNRIMLEEGMHLTSKLVPGRMYFYYYDPKLKDTLPYYDQFPLLIPFGKTQGSFTGLNLHYLDYKPRMALFKELLTISGNNHISDSSKIKYTWDMVRSAAKTPGFKACVKMYLEDHVRSPFCEIPPTSWHTAVMLPVQRFVGASKESVWKESRNVR